ncbi:MAG: deoxyribodipyrimidine photo-lyase, partial [Planctomycetota bacterium]
MTADGPIPSSLSRLLRGLPQRLAERSAVVSGSEVNEGGSFVLYWAHHALRADENPALDAAGELAMRLGKPLLLFAGLPGSHPYLSDRHATFLIEGYRDFSAQLAAIGVPFACGLSVARRPTASLDALASRSALVVTEDFPAAPFPEWTASLARRTGRAVVAVDTACLVPMNRVDGVYDRAFAFREATERERAARVAAAWPTASWRGRPWGLVDHGIPEVDWPRLDVAETVSALDIDHSIAPVPDTRGGGAAGYARWNAFRAERLARYAEDRNDAAIEGVSRMSAYLHYGMVSPMRVAREAHAAGADKYLDELLVWRELSYHWCRHVPEHASLHALPAWARRTLDEHRGDARTVLSADRLARAATGDALWDLAQRSLVVHGELHNNLRMTWGKAIAQWSATPEQALERMIWLNDRYALDGCDPASYGGILWCLGLFDRAFSPETPVLGSVRARPLEI